jgi:hypothetical protein
MRELGAAYMSDANSIQNADIATDSASNVTILGTFIGTFDFSGTTLSSQDGGAPVPTSSPYLMRFDASGNVVFARVLYPSYGYAQMNVVGMAVAPDGTSTVLANAYTRVSLLTTAAEYFLQYDSKGALLSQGSQGSPSSMAPWIGQMTGDPAGGLWAVGGTLNAVFQGFTPTMVMHLTSAGAVTWTQPYAIDGSATLPLFAGGAAGAVLLEATGGGYGTEPVQETLWSYPSSGASPSSQTSTEPSYVGSEFAEQLVLDANGDTIVGGEFFGTHVTSADGSTDTSPTPSGIGFQAFDATGHFRSVKTWSGAAPGGDQFGAVAVDPRGNVLLAGTEGPGQETTSVFLAKLAL